MAFQGAIPGGDLIVAIGIVLFAYSTILGWCYYGEKSMEFLMGEKSILPYRLVFVAFVMVGSTMKLETAWTLADIFNGLMALPNLIALLLLTPVIMRITKEYLETVK